jgi:hypothetical protein
MQNQALKIQLQRLEELFKKVDQACATDLEMRAHWAKYLCVLVSGFLENAISEIYADFVKNAASQPVASYAAAILSKIQNPKTHKFLEVAGLFKKDWARDLEVYVEENGRKVAIDSIMTHRHNIVHGKTSGITIAAIKDYLEKSVEVLEFIENQTLS